MLSFIKAPPSTYVLQYKDGRIKREGAGLSFIYYGPTSTIVAVNPEPRKFDGILLPFLPDQARAAVKNVIDAKANIHEVTIPRQSVKSSNAHT